MRRREFIAALVPQIVVPAAFAQAPTNRRLRIAVLVDAGEAELEPVWPVFSTRMRELGHVEGRDYELEFRYARGALDRLPELARELLAGKPDLVVANSTVSALAAKRVTSTIPIVFVASADPIASGLVRDYAHPGGNVTGQSIVVTEVAAKWIDLLSELVPGLARMAFLGPSANPAVPAVHRALQEFGQKRGIEVRHWDARNANSIEQAFRELPGDGIGAFAVANTQVLLPYVSLIVGLASRARLPGIYARKEYVEAGGLISFGRPNRLNWISAAGYVDRILRGAKPADLPVERPTQFELIVNAKTAAALGRKIPTSILLRADQVIE